MCYKSEQNIKVESLNAKGFLSKIDYLVWDF